MLTEIISIIIALSILLILFFAFMKKEQLPKLIAFTILGSIALSMLLSGFAGLIADVEFLNFLESFFRTVSDFVVFVEIGLIVFLLFFSKHKTKITLLKVTIIIYIVLKLILVLGII